MSNPAASSLIPCCGQTVGWDSVYTVYKGTCIRSFNIVCCNGTKGFILDATAVNGGPNAGTYAVHGGGFLEIVSLSMVPDHQFIKFGPTVNASGATLDERLPRNVCCYQVIGLAYCIERNSSMVEFRRGMLCVTASLGSVGIGFYRWFHKPITDKLLRAICAKPHDWKVLGGNESLDANSLTSGGSFRFKGYDSNNIGYEVSGNSCKDRCLAPVDVTITISGLAGMEIDDGAGDVFTIVDDEYSVTFTVSNTSCGSWGLTVDSGSVGLELSHPTLSGYCLHIGLRLEYDDSAGRFFIRAAVDEGDTEYGIVRSDCDDPDSFQDQIVTLSQFNFPQVECGANNVSGTGTVTVTDWFSSITMGTADVTVTVN